MTDTASADRQGIALPLQTPFGSMLFPASCKVIPPYVAHFGFWAPQESIALQAMVSPGDTFLDLGAHVGYMSILATRLVGTAGKVISVEPTPETAAILRHNATHMNGGVEMLVHECAAAATDGEGFMHIHAVNTGDNRSYDVQDGMHGEHVTIQKRSLDTLLAGEGRIDVIKMDVQGAEHDATRGMLGILSDHRPAVITEFWPAGLKDAGAEPEDFLAIWRNLGYSIRSLGFFAAGDLTDAEAITIALNDNNSDTTLILVPPRG